MGCLSGSRDATFRDRRVQKTGKGPFGVRKTHPPPTRPVIIHCPKEDGDSREPTDFHRAPVAVHREASGDSRARKDRTPASFVTEKRFQFDFLLRGIVGAGKIFEEGARTRVVSSLLRRERGSTLRPRISFPTSKLRFPDHT